VNIKSFSQRFLATIAAIAAFTFVFGGTTSPALAAPNQDLLSVYIDAPFVQGSYVADAAQTGTAWTNFNNTTGAGHCGDNQPAGVTITGTCNISAVSVYGGATALANNGTATVAGAGSAYATTANANDPITVTLDSNNRYLGLWWSAGSPSNTVKFYNDNKLLLTMTTADIMTLLGTAPTNASSWTAKNNDNAGSLLTAVGGGTYRKVWYFGNPRGYTSTTPSSIATVTPGEPFMYLHMFVGGALTFNKVVLSGGGFEFDNLAVSTQAQTPAAGLVNVSTIYANHTVTFDGNASGVTETMTPQVASTPSALSTNVFNRAGYTFAGWNTLANGNGTTYANLANYDFDEDVTLYAVWTQDAAPGGSGSDTDLANTGFNSLGLAGIALALLAIGLVASVPRRRNYR
jgi:uncharacterized repeat protein (TIGR02543 family)